MRHRRAAADQQGGGPGSGSRSPGSRRGSSAGGAWRAAPAAGLGGDVPRPSPQHQGQARLRRLGAGAVSLGHASSGLRGGLAARRALGAVGGAAASGAAAVAAAEAAGAGAAAASGGAAAAEAAAALAAEAGAAAVAEAAAKGSGAADSANTSAAACGQHTTTTTASPAATTPAAATAATTAAAPRAPSLGRASYRLLLAYDGGAYRGWQLQPGGPTIQGVVERALSTALQEPRELLGVCAAGRTDAGVHARGQVVQFYTDHAVVDTARMPLRLNSLLPNDIRVMAAHRTAPDFHVTVSATSKTYRYYIDTGRVHDPLTARHRAHIPGVLDVGAMAAGAALFEGSHDFTQFSSNSPERLRRNPIRSITSFRVEEVEGGLQLQVEGSGFLYKQVRHMVGALIALAQGKLALENIRAQLRVGSSHPPGAGGLWRGYKVAPAKGLQLLHVSYPAAADDPSTLLYPDLPHDCHGRLLCMLPGPGSAGGAGDDAGRSGSSSGSSGGGSSGGSSGSSSGSGSSGSSDSSLAAQCSARAAAQLGVQAGQSMQGAAGVDGAAAA